MSKKSLIAAVQLTSTNDKIANLQKITRLIEQCALRGARMVFLPECSDYVAQDGTETMELAESIDGPFITGVSSLAQKSGIWLALGVHRKGNSEKPYNSQLLLDNNGNIRGCYDKIHLFDSELARILESNYISKGHKLIPPVSSPFGSVGLMICFDLRFPELARELARNGADILTYPSAFHPVSGASHWEPLLRARAIENQAYVVAAAQVGQHNSKRSSYGHTMIVDPWGTVVGQCNSQQTDTFCMAEVDLEFKAKVEQLLPVVPASYYLSSNHGNIDDCYVFGPHSIRKETVFYETFWTFGFVNLRPIVPGHILISPRRKVERFKDLTGEELTDLWASVQKVSRAVEKIWVASSMNVALQDGPFAGQSVPHVHVHILPRRPGDFERTDDVHEALEQHSYAPAEGIESFKAVIDPEKRRTRSLEEMAAEAKQIREHLDDS